MNKVFNNIQEIAFTELSYDEHCKLLFLSGEPRDDYERGKLVRENLHLFFEQYHQILLEIAVAIENYREIAAQINARQPLIKRKDSHNS